MRNLVIPVLAASLLLPFPAGAAPWPGADDAGTGGDAPDDPLLAATVAPYVLYPAALGPGDDPADHYAFTATAGSLLRVTVTGTVSWPFALEGTLTDPSGTVRAYGYPGLNWTGFTFDVPFDLVAYADVGGTWLLSLTGGASNLFDSIGYSFIVRSEVHEHVVAFGAPDGETFAVHAGFPADQFVHLELLLDFSYELLSGSLWILEYAQAYGTATGGNETYDWAWGSTSAYRSTGVGGAAVWTHNLGPQDLSLEPPSALAEEGRFQPFALESGEDPFTFDLGVAVNGDLRARGWLVWDGAEPPFSLPTGSTATFLRVRDLEGSGQGAVVGPLATTSGRLAGSFEAPHEVVVALADAGPGWFTTGSPTLDVTRPGQPTETFRGQDRFWAFDAAPSGHWDLGVQSVNGVEGDLVRFGAASFPIDSPFL